jgi:glycopeptide antibiotics resistance protein
MNLQKTGQTNLHAKTTAKRFTIALLIIYLIALCWILLFKLGVRFSYMEGRSVNLIPFSKPSISNGRADVSEIILNAVIFVPLGIYTGVLFDKWNFGRKLLFFFLISLIVEGLQFALAVGAFDITDIIINTFGGMVGLMAYKSIEAPFNNRIQAHKFINIISAAGTVVVIVFLLLLKLNMLPIRYQ